jgi:high-affinity nickel-transport protein
MTLGAALLSSTALGLQHGIDWDHVAAISDVTSVQRTPRDAIRCGLVYAAGHSATVGLLGIAVITLRQSLPDALSVWMQRFIGLTLVLMGAYVVGVLFSGGPIMSGVQAVAALLQGRSNTGAGYGRRCSLSLGVLHGIGAETPTQLSMLMIAANAGRVQSGLLVLGAFSAAMFASNLVLTTAAAGVFTISKPKPVLFRLLALFAAGYSIWIGIAMIRSQ